MTSMARASFVRSRERALPRERRQNASARPPAERRFHTPSFLADLQRSRR